MAEIDDLILEDIVSESAAPTNIERATAAPASVPASPATERDRFYASIPSNEESELRATADRIRDRNRQSVIDIGTHLLKIKDGLPGRFAQWLKLEFNMSKSTAWNYINAVQQFGSTPKVIEILPPGTVYKLAAKATPEDVRKTVVKEIAGGKQVTAQDVERRIAEARDKERQRKGSTVPKKPDSAEIVKAKQLSASASSTDDMAKKTAHDAAKILHIGLNAEDLKRFKTLIASADLAEFRKAL